MGMKVKGIWRAEQRIKKVQHRAEHPEAVWPKVGSFVAMAMRKQFATKGAYMGTPWKPLKPASIKAKQKRGFGGKGILVESGAMRKSFTSRPMSQELYFGNTALFGSLDYKAKWHHYGTHRNGRPAIPARPLLRATPEMTQGISKIFKAYITGENISVRGLI